MSLVNHQKSCAGCGGLIGSNDDYCVEPLVDASIRYIVRHWYCNTFTDSKCQIHDDHADTDHCLDS